ncbi:MULTISPECIES: TetR/AcrR family transcriptional regulator [Paenibacillus]|uniref:TetR/AcrR family transcriptional regulator n=1 Tax=Paenibacillus TaxID=44249 RepID=UPI000B7FFD8D|nr:MULTISPECIES: TetR/AcrR family transcriptional regulator [unclassified Paenibacillus]UYO06201.1 TetR/AcrR family transcriptional regulator [Paenibacillus sp. PSB04]
MTNDAKRIIIKTKIQFVFIGGFKLPQFSPAEKEKLRQDLIDAGKKLFAAQGLKKTSLEQLTAATGIAKSTFYAFYDSKEAMYLDLLELESAGMEERVWAAVEKQSDAYNGIIAYLRQMVLELKTNPLTKKLIMHPQEMELLRRRVPPEFIERKLQRNVIPLMNYIEQQQIKGEIINKDSGVIVGMMRAAMLIEVHKQEFDEKLYAEIEEIMFHAVASALTISPVSTKE